MVFLLISRLIQVKKELKAMKKGIPKSPMVLKGLTHSPRYSQGTSGNHSILRSRALGMSLEAHYTMPEMFCGEKSNICFAEIQV